MSAEKRPMADNGDGMEEESKRHLNTRLDEFISREKQELVAGDEDEGQQQRLDDFLDKLHKVHDEAAVAVNEEPSRESRFNVYNIEELNENRASGRGGSKAIQAVAAIVVAGVLAGVLWLAGEQPPRAEKRLADTPEASQAEAVSAAPPAEEKARAEEPVVAAVQAKKLTVVLSFGNVRSGPSGGADVITQLKKGDVVTELEAKWGWHNIRLADGREGWAYQSLFVVPAAASVAQDVAAEESEVKAAAVEASQATPEASVSTLQVSPESEVASEPQTKPEVAVAEEAATLSDEPASSSVTDMAPVQEQQEKTSE
ncbi:SH3 domain-containing protein [Mariprofundus ferrinatatus]|uniref:SH3 domain-containing protein n=1 Tax=Mariprofundus ferrinatatus TaxID=1921087 RepID=A0A2K8L5B5_9PROT|nr:SH3 domain-containing protein [Mariprofundus ferrinatatus]ATX82433.1 SH3 domain-containing protein [Mariprofundus ferrinatatus]